MLTVGIPKETKTQELRVGLSPQAVKVLTGMGVKVLVEHNAGSGSQYPDDMYLDAGATIVPDQDKLYAQADLIQKVKEPQAKEFSYLRENQILFCFLHLASQEQCALVKALRDRKVTALAFETLSLDGKLPMLGPMSQLAGGLSAIYAAFFHSLHLVHDGQLVYPEDFFQRLTEIARNYPSHLEYPKMGKVIIFGGGIAGMQAADVARDLHADVTIVEPNEDRRTILKQDGLHVIGQQEVSMGVLSDADVFIGSAHSAGKRAVKVVEESLFYESSKLKPKIIVDIAIDQGGNFPDARSTSYEQPIYLDQNRNLRFSVPNLPSLCGKAASDALSEVVLPYTKVLVHGLSTALHQKPEIHSALNIKDGKILLESIRKPHQL